MADSIVRLVVDCSVVVKWKIPSEDHAAAAEALLLESCGLATNACTMRCTFTIPVSDWMYVMNTHNPSAWQDEMDVSGTL